jgi:hypothetical protein
LTGIKFPDKKVDMGKTTIWNPAWISPDVHVMNGKINDAAMQKARDVSDSKNFNFGVN